MKEWYAILCLAWAGSAGAVEKPIHLAPYDNREPLFASNWDNDLFFVTYPPLNEDKGYTQSSLFIFPDKSDLLPYFQFMDVFNHLALCGDEVPSCQHRRLRLTGRNTLVGQTMYTPKEKEDTVIDFRDRPYAAFLYLGRNFKYSPAPDSSLGMPRWQLTNRHLFGTMGYWALGENTQNWVHRNISGTPEALGWRFQTRPQLAYQFNSQLDYIAWPRKRCGSWELFDATVSGNLGLGMIFRGLNLGGSARFGRLHPSFFGYGEDISQGEKLESGRLRYNPKAWGWFRSILHFEEYYLVGGAKTIVVQANRMLEGGDFVEWNPHTVEPERLVYELNWGAGLNATLFSRLNLDFALINTMRTPEFRGGRGNNFYGGFSAALSWIVDRRWGPNYRRTYLAPYAGKADTCSNVPASVRDTTEN